MPAALLAFALAATLLIVAPGPDSLLVMRNTLRGGRRAGWITAGGTMSGLLVWAASAALGVTELLRVSRLGFDIVRFAGAGYLIWLGVSTLGLARRRRCERGHPSPGRPARPRRTGSGTGRVGRLSQRAAVQPLQSQDRRLLRCVPAGLHPRPGPGHAVHARARPVVHRRDRGMAGRPGLDGRPRRELAAPVRRAAMAGTRHRCRAHRFRRAAGRRDPLTGHSPSCLSSSMSCRSLSSRS